MKLQELLQSIDLIREKNEIPEVYVCGGTPRDKYLTGSIKSIHDLDLCTGSNTAQLLASEVFGTLRKTNNIQLKKHEGGHSTLYFGNLQIDFSSHFVIPNVEKIVGKPLSELQKEMFSRDFGCNALLLSLDMKKLFDPTDKGVSELKQKIIKTCLSPEITLNAYPNRAIRSIYLAAKLGFDLAPELENYIKQNPKVIQVSSQKSMIEKLNKAFEVDPDKSIHLLTKLGLWNYVPVVDNMIPYKNKIPGHK